MRTIPIWVPRVNLSELPHRTAATVVAVEDAAPGDAVARRLRELGFVAGEVVEVLAAGPFGAEPLLVHLVEDRHLSDKELDSLVRKIRSHRDRG